MMFDSQYENMRRIAYGDADSYHGQAIFIPVCENCCRFVKADENVYFNDHGLRPGENATCSKCGRVHMLFEGFF